ncbi:Disease resistance protein RPM1, putative [Ricinus communis]|uniref:Disease resistance protein RPM1, putative n=2 Tax=Ricinus communis TaxID=3988 RepID=B9SW10_RICCO|nr:Disease resistance protein RPM1, putative [Ricinus communis]
MGTVAKGLEIGGKAEALMDNVVSEDDMQTLRRKLQQLESIKADKVEELQTAVLQTAKKPMNELQIWSRNISMAKVKVQNMEQEVKQGGLSGKLLGKRVKKMMEEMKELIDQNARFQGRLVSDAGDNSRVALLAPKLVCQAFEINKEKIWQYLEEGEGFCIGIWGMGGVGKTTLLTYIYNELLRKQKNVYWITVSQDFSVRKLQNHIAKAIDRDISIEDDEKKRAALLWNALSNKQKFVLILDDLWENFSLENVGIPISKENGCKLIFTSRSLEVCNKMDCRRKIKVEPLSEEEAWNLFQEKLGEKILDDGSEIAKSIAKRCAGLPLGIITMASSMKGVDDLSEWRNTLRILEDSKVGEGDNEFEVFRILKFSYDRLGNSALQKCYLYCALYPEDRKIRRVELIDYLIAEGVIEEKSRQAEFDKGHTMLNKLEKVCLLEPVCDNQNYRCVKMHDLIRHMAIQLMKADIVVCAKSRALDCKSWTAELVRISSMYSGIKEIPSNHSPPCPKVSVLLLPGSYLRWIPDPFFEQLHGLKILDLSNSVFIEELPTSVSNLCNLSTLLLKRCYGLRRVPSLAKLKSLKKLDLNFSGVEEVPQDMEFLSNLKHLGLFGTFIKEFPPGILPKLSRLQVLLLDPRLPVKGVEVASLRNLETLCCCLCDFNEFNTYFQSSKERPGLALRDKGFWIHQLKDYFVWVGKESNDLPKMKDKIFNFEEELEFVLGKRAVLGNYSVMRGEGSPKEFKMIEIQSYHTGWLCLENESPWKKLEILNCVGIESLFPLCSSSVLQTLEKIQIRHSMNLHVLFNIAPPAATVRNGTFSLLKTFEIYGCPSMKKLFPHGLMANLKNLSQIYVRYCENMEELIAIEEEQESHQSNASNSYTIPELRSFKLEQLPELKSICSRQMICNHLQYLWIINCPKLKRIPISLVLLENHQIAPLPSLQEIIVSPPEWWEMAEVDHPNAKNILSPLVLF